MISKRYLYTRAILLVFMLIAVFGTISTADAQKVHALLVIMDDDLDIRRIVDANRLRVKKMFQLLDVNPEIWQADDRQIRPDHISEWIRNRQIDTEDTILVYYSGHGHIDRKARHYLDLDMQNATSSLLRSDLAEELSEKRCRLKMLITDTCSNRVQTSPLIAQSSGTVVSRKRRYTQDLFLKHSGFLDITAASPGQYAWGNNEIGGYFTAALIESFTRDSDTNTDGFLSWEEVFLATRDETQRLFSETTFQLVDERKMNNIGQTTQTPKKYSLPGRLTHPAPAVLTMTSDPSGASVYIDDIKVGKTPLEEYEVNVGMGGERQIKMRLELDGYESMDLSTGDSYSKETGESTLQGGMRYTWKNKQLKKLATTATLSVASDPSGASVYIDDIKVGKTPLEEYEVNVGMGGERQIKMRLELDGYESMGLYLRGSYNKETGESTLQGGRRYTWTDVHLEKIATKRDRASRNDKTDSTPKNDTIWNKIFGTILLGLFGSVWLLILPWFRASGSEKWNNYDADEINYRIFFFSWIFIIVTFFISGFNQDGTESDFIGYGLCVFPILLGSFVTAIYIFFFNTPELGLARFIVIVLSLVAALFVPSDSDKINFLRNLRQGLLLGGMPGLSTHFICWIVNDRRKEDLSYKIRRGLPAAIVLCGYAAAFLIWH